MDLSTEGSKGIGEKLKAIIWYFSYVFTINYGCWSILEQSMNPETFLYSFIVSVFIHPMNTETFLFLYSLTMIQKRFCIHWISVATLI